MQALFTSNAGHEQPLFRPTETISVAISANFALHRADILALVHNSGAQIVNSVAAFDVFLFPVDQFTTTAALKHIAKPAKSCAIWSGTEPSHNVLLRVLRANVAGILPISASPHQFLVTLAGIRAGLQVIHPRFSATKRDLDQLSAPLSPEAITPREEQVLIMLAEGLSNKEIAARLNISTHTVKFHISSILGKLGAESRTEAVSIGIRTGKIAI